MNMPLFSILRTLNHKRKDFLKARRPVFMSPCRRIEAVYPLKGQRVCAMTFDDGPFGLPPLRDTKTAQALMASGGASPDEPCLTALLCQAFARHGFSATFDVVGSTADHYPDEPGAPGTHFALGNRYDHYPLFGRDADGGALARPDLITLLHRSGMELSNHSFSHILYGRKRMVYGRRAFLPDRKAVYGDLVRLHTLVREITGQEMKLARPPHYVDDLPDGASVYDVYAHMGYHYMAARVDGGGWLPSKGDYKQDVEDMVAPLRALLQHDPDALSGILIFGKDGCNLSLTTPVADALPLQLQLLKEYGYRVVTVSELMALSAFEDLPPEDELCPLLKRAEEAGHVTGYRDNTFRPDQDITLGELCMMTAPRLTSLDDGFVPGAHPYRRAMAWAVERALLPQGFASARKATAEDITRFAAVLGGGTAGGTTRRDAAALLYGNM